ncbi:hypothetical protein [Maribacter sp. 2210JD10-5]|uniref:hypothetical protein n=1 Tax=Maribacter sp. 2210JD10-5 TaxID=3386272 RepID=UPI0039BD5B9E
MTDIHPIYNNQFGVAFQCKRASLRDIKRIQLVFRDTGLLLSYDELLLFSKNILHTRKNSPLCEDCKESEQCKALLVNSPASQITFAMNVKELDAIQDLVEGTLFQLKLDNFLSGICKSD